MPAVAAAANLVWAGLELVRFGLGVVEAAEVGNVEEAERLMAKVRENTERTDDELMAAVERYRARHGDRSG